VKSGSGDRVDPRLRSTGRKTVHGGIPWTVVKNIAGFPRRTISAVAESNPETIRARCVLK